MDGPRVNCLFILVTAIFLLLAVTGDVLPAGPDSCAQNDPVARMGLRWAEIAGTITHDGPVPGGAWTAEVRANASYTVVEGPGRGGAPSVVLGGGSEGEWRAAGRGVHPCDLAIEGEVGPFRSIIGEAEYRIRVACAGASGEDADSAAGAQAPPGALVLEGKSCGNRLKGSIEPTGEREGTRGKTAWDLEIRPVSPPPFGDFCDALLWTGAGDPQLLFLRLAPALRDEGVMEAYRKQFPDLSTRSAALGLSYEQILRTCKKLEAAWLVDESGPGAETYDELMTKWPAATRLWTAHKRGFETALASALDAIATAASTDTVRREILGMAERVRARGMESLYGMSTERNP
ncbi:MAG TPA: hypothetical protein VM737_03690 [Gemmatimonadota bacterium]|nr:hypothetical protein [Gemmatimonadota bacterium]